MSAIGLVPAAPATNPTREIDFPAGIAAFPLARSHDRSDSNLANQMERTAELSTCGRFRWTLTRDWPGFGRLTSRGLRSEEHTSELQSLMRISYAVFCLKKNIKKHLHINKL